MKRETGTATSQSERVLELKKHVAIIHSSNRLTLLQRKIANALLFNAYKDLQEKDEFTINISRLCEIIGYDSNDHKSIKAALVNLISTVLEWNLIDGERLDSEGVWNASSIIAGASIDGSSCTYSYSSQMRKLLYRPHMYGRLDMAVQAKFQSTYGLALYENCNRFQDIGQTPWFSLEKFRKLMGVENDKYKIFRDFKTRVLDKAVEEVNRYSPLRIVLQLRKQNRQVVSIQFLINKQQSSDPVSQTTADTASAMLKDKFGLTAKQIDQVLSQYEISYINEKMKLIFSSASFKNGQVKNLAKYLLSALRDDYQSAEASASHDVAATKHASISPEMQTRYLRFQEAELFKLFNSLAAKEKTSLAGKFEKFLKGVYQQLYLREGFQNILIREQLSIFLKKIRHEWIGTLPSYGEWANSIQNVTGN